MSDLPGLIQLLAPYGPTGLLCAYLLWREHKRDEREARRNERDEGIREAQAEADRDLAVALTLLTERIGHVRAM